MGLFNLWESTNHTPNHKNKLSFKGGNKLSRNDIIDLVHSISSLDYRQKKTVQEYLERELDSGGVTKWEYKKLVNEMSRNRVELDLSTTDIRNLRKLIYR